MRKQEWAKRVRAARQEKEWTQAHLAELAGTSQSSVANAENGLGVGDDLKVSIALALGKDPADLFPLIVDEPTAEVVT